MTIKIFVGTGANGEDAESCMVLDYTIRKHCSQPVDIVWMQLSRGPSSFWSGWDTSLWATPFSGFRWGISAFCGYQGRAIYLDSDMIVQADLAQLWNLDLEDKIIAAKGGWRFCVMLMDCEGVGRHLPPIERLKQFDGHKITTNFFKGRPDLVQTFDPAWNYCDNEDFGPLSEAKIIHYTDMSSQPHLTYAIPRLAEEGQEHWFDGLTRPHPRREISDLFDSEYRAALRAGYLVSDYVPTFRFGTYKKQSLVHYKR